MEIHDMASSFKYKNEIINELLKKLLETFN